MDDEMLIPRQEKGTQKDFEYGITLTSLAYAKGLFDIAKHRLLHIDKWHEYAGMISADFKLVDENRVEQIRAAMQGDYIRIDIPGPSGPDNKFDWVRIQDIRYEMPDSNNELIFLKLQPSPAPGEKADEEVAHFFEEGASSSFILKREARDVHISYHGRNEVTNTHTDSTVQNIRNWLVGLNAMMGFSDMQWKSLIKGIITTEEQSIINDKKE